ncbi:hypothetical protein [Mycobacterium sp. AZCC_0083]|uniref:DUF7239 family protein n=1 Tax=Mycobacterium sp. AZCC_0083 TaxID=2735882 RepID=UPI001616C3CB|nr:hypothetical protein [Mycobacterium sp. AZCC_0083]MBB5167133.1 hypothetical protein [Mycobacterium sp. AZCC_0083]
MSDPREEKLPRWAREELARERHRAATAEHRLAEHLETVEPTHIWYGDWKNKLYIPSERGYQTVYFSATGEPSKYSYDEVGVRMKDGVLSVSASRAVSVEPIASNCFDVRVRD